MAAATVRQDTDEALAEDTFGTILPGSSPRSSSPRPVAMNTFRREGDYWTVEYDGSVVRLRNARGLQYLALLLRHRGQYIAAADLLQAIDREHQLPAPVAALRLGAVPGAERARSSVSKRIHDAMRRIHAHHPALGRHLKLSIKTGHRCAYLPDPDENIAWGL